MKKILLLFLLSCIPVRAVTLAWDPSVDTNVTSYVLYWGTNSGSYTMSTNVGTNLVFSLSNSNLAGFRWYFVVTARDDIYGLESDPSNEVNCFINKRPSPPQRLNTTTLTAKVEGSKDPLGPWKDEYIMVTNLSLIADATYFYRTKLAIEK